VFDIGKKDDSSPGGSIPPKPSTSPTPASGGVTASGPSVSPPPKPPLGGTPTLGGSAPTSGPAKPPLGGLPSRPTPPPAFPSPVGGPKPPEGEPNHKELMAELKDIKSILARMVAKSGG